MKDDVPCTSQESRWLYVHFTEINKLRAEERQATLEAMNLRIADKSGAMIAAASLVFSLIATAAAVWAALSR